MKSIFEPEGAMTLLGPNSKCKKPAWYDGEKLINATEWIAFF